MEPPIPPTRTATLPGASTTEISLGREYAALRVDSDLAHEVAAGYLDGPSTPGAALMASYQQLALETDRFFAALTSTSRRDPVQVGFTKSEAPYDSAQDLITSVSRDRLLEVTVAAVDCDRFHPMMDWAPEGAFDRFRAVHDIVGHSFLRVGFDRHAEYATWRFQERFHSPLARQALAIELHAKHSVRWTTGASAAHKAVRLDPRLIHESRITGRSAGGILATLESAPQSPAYLCSCHGSP